MNEYEIERAVERLQISAPDVAHYAGFLKNWVDIVNENSDGWPYWKAAGSSAVKLMKLVQDAERGSVAPEADFKKALTPIKSLATRKGLPQPALPEPQPKREMRM